MVLKVSIISINDFIFCQIKGHWPAAILKICCQRTYYITKAYSFKALSSDCF